MATIPSVQASDGILRGIMVTEKKKRPKKAKQNLPDSRLENRIASIKATKFNAADIFFTKTKKQKAKCTLVQNCHDSTFGEVVSVTLERVKDLGPFSRKSRKLLVPEKTFLNGLSNIHNFKFTFGRLFSHHTAFKTHRMHSQTT